jgi:hypothetical protein
MISIAARPRGLARNDRAAEARITNILVVSRACSSSTDVDQRYWLGDILKRCNIRLEDASTATRIVWGHSSIPDLLLKSMATREFGRGIWDAEHYSTETHSFVDTCNAGGRVLVVRQLSEKPRKRSWGLWN